VISLTSPAAGAALTADMRLAGIADGNGSALTALSYTFDGGAPIPLLFDARSGVFDAPIYLGELLVGDHTTCACAPSTRRATSPFSNET
jgi:hypothetical protein